MHAYETEPIMFVFVKFKARNNSETISKIRYGILLDILQSLLRTI